MIFRTPSYAADAAPRVSGSKGFGPGQNLAAGGLCPPRMVAAGEPPEKPRFSGTGDIIEAFTMEEIPR